MPTPADAPPAIAAWPVAPFHSRAGRSSSWRRVPGAPADNQPGIADHACKRTHGTARDLLSLIPAPVPGKEKDDPFVTLSCRAAKAWLTLFGHARALGTWRPSYVDPLRPELTEGQQFILTAHWTVVGLAYAMGVNRDTAGKALKELVAGGWVRREVLATRASSAASTTRWPSPPP